MSDYLEEMRKKHLKVEADKLLDKQEKCIHVDFITLGKCQLCGKVF